MRSDSKIDILIPTYNRPTALAITLTSLCFQEYKHFNIIISDQGEKEPAEESEEVQAIVRMLQARGIKVKILKNFPRQGMAHQRQFLLEQSNAAYVLYLDDDLILEPYVIGELLQGIQEEQCGLVGTGTIGLNYLDDVRGHEQMIEFWETKVSPEMVIPHSQEWNRHRIHSAANIFHLQNKLNITSGRPKKYKLAWASACVLYDREKLLNCGGFNFWKVVPRDHCGEDVAAQLKVIATYGGCGMLPCGVYHQELKTTLPDRRYNIPDRLPLFDPTNQSFPEWHRSKN